MVLTQRLELHLQPLSTLKSFHTTMVLTQLWTNGRHIGLRRNVSIPLWFLRNQSYREHWQAAKQVSIPLWFLRNLVLVRDSRNSKTFPYHYGSYATGMKNVRKRHKGITFPYHYGSYATESPIHEVLAWHGFPYHYGSYATWQRVHGRGSHARSFPYHYGSYATASRSKNGEASVVVSIPLWFLRNRFWW